MIASASLGTVLVRGEGRGRNSILVDRTKAQRAPARSSRKSRARGLPRAVWIPFVLGFLAYLPTLSHSFVWDDVNFIQENPAAQSLRELPSALRHGFGWVSTSGEVPHDALYFRPVVTIANTLQWVASGGHPWLFHLANVFTHALSAGLLAALALLLGLSSCSGLLAGGLFALHPVASEAVAWISGRSDLLAGLFVLATLALLAAWRRGTLPPRLGRRVPWPAGLTLFFALASKEGAWALLVLAPLMVAVRPPAPIRMKEGNESPSRLHAFLCLAAGAGLYLLLRVLVLGDGALGGEESLPGRGTLSMRVLQGGALFLAYLLRASVPWPLQVEPPAWVTLPHLAPGVGAAGLALLVGAGFLCLRSARRAQRAGSARDLSLALGLGLFLLALLPVLQWIPTGEIFAERFFYLPLAGLLLAGSAASDPWVSKRASAARRLFMALALLFVVLLELRLPAWKDDLSLWESTARARPDSARALANFGSALIAAGRQAEAEPILAQAVALDPADPHKRGQHGSLLVNLGRIEEGVAELQRASMSERRSSKLLKNLGIGWTHAGRYDEAAAALTEALALAPEDASVLEALAMAERKRGLLPEATAHYERAIEQDPGRPAVYLNLISMLHNEAKDPERTGLWAQRFLARFPSAPEAPMVRALLAAPGASTPSP